MLRIAPAAEFLAVVPTLAAAQNAPASFCKNGALPFAAADANRVAGARDVGLWSIKNNALRAVSASFGERSEGRFAIHRQGPAVAAKQLSGNRSFRVEGAITLR